MDELIQRICSQTGLPEAQARQAAQVAVDFLKEKLPEPMRGQVDGLLAGQVSPDAMSQAMGMLGGMFGNKQ